MEIATAPADVDLSDATLVVGVLATTGCLGGVVNQALLRGDVPMATKLTRRQFVSSQLGASVWQAANSASR